MFHGTHPQASMSIRYSRVLRTMSECLDALLAVTFHTWRDLVVQHLKAVQTASVEGSWGSAQHTELPSVESLRYPGEKMAGANHASSAMLTTGERLQPLWYFPLWRRLGPRHRQPRPLLCSSQLSEEHSLRAQLSSVLSVRNGTQCPESRFPSPLVEEPCVLRAETKVPSQESTLMDSSETEFKGGDLSRRPLLLFFPESRSLAWCDGSASSPTA